jgi:hypothetical protein
MRPGPRLKPKPAPWSSEMDESSHREPSPESNPDVLTTQLVTATAAARRIVSIWSGDSPQTIRIGLDELRTAFAQIIRARAVLEAIPSDPPPKLADALCDYRAALEQLQPHLPRFEGWLLTERVRLDARRAHAASVHSWFAANQHTR